MRRRRGHNTITVRPHGTGAPAIRLRAVSGALSDRAEALHAAGLLKPLLQLGLRDEFIEHGDPAKLLALQGLDAAGIEAAIPARFVTLLSESRPALKVAA